MVELSREDVKILELLQSDASRSSAEIAQHVNMSQSPCWRRINRLEVSGVIQKKVAIVDREKLGLALVAFTTVNLAASGLKNLESFERSIRQFDEVVECYTMTGAWDYMLKIVVKDIRHYETFVRNKLLEIALVGEVHSHLAVTEIKNTTELPVRSQMS